MKKLFSLILILFNSLILSACLGPAKTITPTQYSLYAVPSHLAVKKSSNATSITVMKPIAIAPFNSSAMIYREGLETGEFNYHTWQSSVPDMLQTQITQTLINVGLYRAVVASQTYADSQYSLRTEILNFEQIFYAQNSVFLLKISATLVDNKDNRIVAQKLFQITEPTAYRNPESGVVAANLATGKFLRQLVGFLLVKY